ncbi:hypothetical protein OB2597_05145 [Pseudooceanicola batsensis HTCC2597]|uniref:KfrA N-terminal DNA-binding domain-containing protein n=1 Tax=Pseudooceanicola batsensis (strain ATCC BAA-863 / DSM 15984 / KCTC 12145 / HTCC2597) TaxID=252305 RepID=A3TSL4_PSEBH|nr:hypothetical protein [Pseudooceanicola batsensis]EAQ04641.1 hypothetical protein OB2597_05145 [Pseudooceanicola batsensis HTCC2597]
MTKTAKNKTNTGGRPHSYDPNLVHQIIADGLAGGTPAAKLDASYVKEKLCTEHGVNGTIRKEALEALVDAVHAEIAEAESRALLKALPGGIASSVDAAVAAAGRELLLVVARQHVTSQGIADKACEELRADKRIAQHRVTELEGDLAEEKTARHKIEQERDAVAQQLADLQEELRVARAEIERLGREPAGFDRLLAELRNPANKADIRAVVSDIMATSSPEPAA